MDWKRGEVASRTVTFEMNSLSRGAECSVASVPLLPWVLVSKVPFGLGAGGWGRRGKAAKCVDCNNKSERYLSCLR